MDKQLLEKVYCRLRLLGKVTFADYMTYLATLTKQERDALTIDLTIRLEKHRRAFQPLLLGGLTNAAYVMYQAFSELLTRANLPDNVRNRLALEYGLLGIILYLFGVFLVLSSHLNIKRKLMIIEHFERNEYVG
ncbi:hypothetical protein NHG34_02085 [Aerococcaceae bacterium NML190938]|nr:hypothetical protein [Aerococcaceae bacterium NML190938]